MHSDQDDQYRRPGNRYRKPGDRRRLQNVASFGNGTAAAPPVPAVGMLQTEPPQVALTQSSQPEPAPPPPPEEVEEPANAPPPWQTAATPPDPTSQEPVNMPWHSAPEAVLAMQKTAPQPFPKPAAGGFILKSNKPMFQGNLKRPAAAPKAGAKSTPTKPAAASAAAAAKQPATVATKPAAVQAPAAQPPQSSAPASTQPKPSLPAGSTLAAGKRSRWGPEEQQEQQQQQQHASHQDRPAAARTHTRSHLRSPAPAAASPAASSHSSSSASSSSSSSSSGSREDGEASPVASKPVASRSHKDSRPRAASPRRDSHGRHYDPRDDRDRRYAGYDDRDAYSAPHRASRHQPQRQYAERYSYDSPRDAYPGQSYPSEDRDDREHRRREQHSHRERWHSGREDRDRRPSRFSQEDPYASRSGAQRPRRPSSGRDHDRHRAWPQRSHSPGRPVSRQPSQERSRREAPDVARDQSRDGPEVSYGTRRTGHASAQPQAAKSPGVQGTEAAQTDVKGAAPADLDEQPDSKPENASASQSRAASHLSPNQPPKQEAQEPAGSQTPSGSAQRNLMSLLGGYASDASGKEGASLSVKLVMTFLPGLADQKLCQRTPASAPTSEPAVPQQPSAPAATPDAPAAAPSVQPEPAATPPPAQPVGQQAAPAQVLTPESARVRLTFSKPKPRLPTPEAMQAVLDVPAASPTAGAPAAADPVQGSQPTEEAADKAQPIEAPPAPAHEEGTADASGPPKSPGVPIDAPPAPRHDAELTSKLARRRERMALLAKANKAKASSEQEGSAGAASAPALAAKAEPLTAPVEEPDMPASPDAPPRLTPPASPGSVPASPDPSEAPPGVSPPHVQAPASPPPPPPADPPATSLPAHAAHAAPAQPHAGAAHAAASHGYPAAHEQRAWDDSHYMPPPYSAAPLHHPPAHYRQHRAGAELHHPQDRGRGSGWDLSSGSDARLSDRDWQQPRDRYSSRDYDHARQYEQGPRDERDWSRGPELRRHSRAHYSRRDEQYRERDRDRERGGDRDRHRGRDAEAYPHHRELDRRRSSRDERSMSMDTEDQPDSRPGLDRGRSRGRSQDADRAPQLSPDQLARQEAVRRAKDAEHRLADELRACAAAFQEVLPLCPGVVPHWQQHADTQKGREDAYTQMYKWRTSGKDGAPHCSYANWDGDASDPVNFPLAAAAAAAPSPLAVFQALLPGLPLDWQVPVIADLAKAPVPLEVQNAPVEALTGDAVPVSWEPAAKELPDPRKPPQPGRRAGPHVVPVPWFAWLTGAVGLEHSDTESNDSWSDQLNKPPKALAPKPAGTLKHSVQPPQTQQIQEQQQDQKALQLAQQPQQPSTSAVPSEQAQPATLQTLQRWLQETGAAAGKKRKLSLFLAEASPADVLEKAEYLDKAEALEQLTAWLSRAHKAAEQAMAAAALCAQLEGRSPPHTQPAGLPAQPPPVTTAQPVPEGPTRPAAAGLPRPEQGAPAAERPARRSPTASASPVNISSTSSGSRSPSPAPRENQPAQQAAPGEQVSSQAAKAQSTAAIDSISERIRADLAAKLPAPSSQSTAVPDVPASSDQPTPGPPGQLGSVMDTGAAQPATAPSQGALGQQRAASPGEEALEQGEIGLEESSSPRAPQSAALPAGAAASDGPQAAASPDLVQAATAQPPSTSAAEAAQARAEAAPRSLPDPAAASVPAGGTTGPPADGGHVQPAGQDLHLADVPGQTTATPGLQARTAAADPGASASQPGEVLLPGQGSTSRPSPAPKAMPELAESRSEASREPSAALDTASDASEPRRARHPARSGKSVSGKRRQAAAPASAVPPPKRRASMPAAASDADDDNGDGEKDVHKVARVTAATRERLTHITNSLIAFDHEETEGIFNYPAPVHYPLYKELCPRPVSLLDIRGKTEKSDYALDPTGIAALLEDAKCMADNCVRYWQPTNADAWQNEEGASNAPAYVEFGELIKAKAIELCTAGIARVKYEAARVRTQVN